MIKPLNVVLGDITKLKVECIVNAANETLLGGGGVDGAIHRAAGPRLRAECKALGGCKTGHAKITNGYDLSAKYIIHTVGPVFNVKNIDKQKKQLSECYKNSLDLAKKHGIHSIAFPSISTGIYGFPHSLACEVAWKTVTDWIVSNYEYDIVVTFCCYDQSTFSLYNKKLQSIIDLANIIM